MELLPLKELVVKYDEDQSRIKLALFAGEVVDVTLAKGVASVGTFEYFISDNFPDGTILSVNIVDSRSEGVYPSLLVRDIKKFGSSPMTSVPFSARFEVLDLVCTSFPVEYGFAMFGGRAIAPYVYAAVPITFTLADKCLDERFIGITVFEDFESTDVSIEEVDDSVDSISRFPPVSDEATRVMKYKPLIQSMIRKMCGKWKDAYKKNHTPGQLPYSAEDLMQQGLMEAIVAIRKFDSSHSSKAQESTFVYRHLWNRFGHIAHKYSKRSRGYGVSLVRDFIDEDGNITTPYDLGVESSRHGYLGNTDPDR